MLEGWRNASQLTCPDCNAKNNIFYMHVVRSHSMLRKYTRTKSLCDGWIGFVLLHIFMTRYLTVAVDVGQESCKHLLHAFISTLTVVWEVVHVTYQSDHLKSFLIFIIHALMHNKSVAIYMVSSDSLCVNNRDDARAVTIVHWGRVSFLGGRGHLWPCHTVNHGLSEHRQTFECTLKKNLTTQYSN